MATLSEWDINCATRKHKVTGDMNNLSYAVTTIEGIECRFCPSPDGLHVYDVNPSEADHAFGVEIFDNQFYHTPERTCHM